MKPILLFYAHDHIFQAVKQESSLYAERKRDKEGNTEFDEFVFDEEYLIKFRELFFDAQTEITAVLSAYMRDVPPDMSCLDMQDFSENRDYRLVLAMPETWNYHLVRPLNIEIKQYMVAYILYRWLETKRPEDAAVYALRAEKTLAGIRQLIGQRTRPVRRGLGF